MALIRKEGNQIYKIYSPEMDISRSSLLSLSNDIAALTSKARMIYRYDNKLEDYDIVHIEYNDLNDSLDIWYEVPEDSIGEFYLQKYVRKSVYWNDTLRIVTEIRYHESDIILNRLPNGVTYNPLTDEVTNSSALSITLPENSHIDLNLSDMTDYKVIPDDIDVVVSSYLKCKLRNVSLDNDITIEAGTYNIGKSSFFVIDNDITIVRSTIIAPIPFNINFVWFVGQGGEVIPAGATLDISLEKTKKTQGERKAIQTMGYDSKNRMIISKFRDGV